MPAHIAATTGCLDVLLAIGGLQRVRSDVAMNPRWLTCRLESPPLDGEGKEEAMGNNGWAQRVLSRPEYLHLAYPARGTVSESCGQRQTLCGDTEQRLLVATP